MTILVGGRGEGGLYITVRMRLKGGWDERGKREVRNGRREVGERLEMGGERLEMGGER